MISAILILNQKGDIVISRNFRLDDLKGAAVAFRLHVATSKEVRSPIVTVHHWTYLFIKVSDLHFVAITGLNVDCTLVFEELYRMAEIMKSYFGDKLNEEAVKEYIVLTYELIDEMMDFGWAQNLNIETLKPIITQKGTFKQEKETNAKKIIDQVTGASPWRNPDTFYKRNQLYIDVVESVNVLISVDGKVLRSDVSGVINMRSSLSGVPECELGLNDKIMMEKDRRGTNGKQGITIDDTTFHQCVRLSRFDTDRTIFFIPPDGEFAVMKYRTTQNIEVPFTITPIVKEVSKNRIDIKCAVKSNYSTQQQGSKIRIRIPVPKNTAICKVKSQVGKAKYYPEESQIIWKIDQFPGGEKYFVGAELELLPTVTKKPWVRPPITMEFHVNMFAASGLTVRFLRVIEKKLGYQAVKWVRYLTQAGSYQYRI